ncbi:hypothetical protein LCGC14_0723180 [marine sediment metagenome]|uniref:DNA N-6-adenine-methyltransferase (Dam) n=1 Tax=marine sediment metagenome TaxID=412755 RepID=A0A0F9QWS0_9ZZZZ
MKRNVVAIDAATTKNDWQTPPAVFAALNAQFGPFDLDLTANAKNHLCERWMGPGGNMPQDALATPWRLYGTRGYSNPPYGRSFVPQLLAKAAQEASLGFDTTLLLPLRVTKAFRQWIIGSASTLYYCDRRICFWEDGHPRWNAKRLTHGRLTPDPAMFDSIVVRFDPHVVASKRLSSLRTDIFQVPPHVHMESK